MSTKAKSIIHLTWIVLNDSLFKRRETLIVNFMIPTLQGSYKTCRRDCNSFWTSFFLGIEQTLGVGVPVIVHGHNIGLIQHFFKNFLVYSSATLHTSFFFWNAGHTTHYFNWCIFTISWDYGISSWMLIHLIAADQSRTYFFSDLNWCLEGPI